MDNVLIKRYRPVLRMEESGDAGYSLGYRDEYLLNIPIYSSRLLVWVMDSAQKRV